MTRKKQKPRYDKRKFLITFCIAMLLFAGIRHIFTIQVPLLAMNNSEDTLGNDDITEVYVGDEDEEFYSESAVPEEEEEENVEIAEEESTDDNPTDGKLPTKDPAEIDIEEETSINYDSTRQNPHRVQGVYSWTECFPDINDVQLVAAQKNGITPVRSRREIKRLIKQHKLVNICHSPYYTVDELTHSMPYLVPKAQHLLNTICLNFIDSLQMKGLPVHLPMVTSVLRTAEDVSKLQKGNGNATTHSCHCYGTTVDITYNRFVPLLGYHNPNAPLLRWDMKMKQVLAEVLNDLRQQGLCYVKYERKQACFHLTVR